MAYRLPPLNTLRAFEAAARHLSFKQAAAELNVTPTAVSHQIRALEEYLGVPLFRRLTRALALTAQAEAMLPKVRAGLDSLAAAVEGVHSGAGGAVLDLVAPPSFTALWLVPRLQQFAAAHPGIRLRVTGTLETIDGHALGAASAVSTADLREESSPVFIRFGAGRYAGFRVERIFTPALVPVCSPRLLEAKRPLRAPEDLRHHLLIHDESIQERGATPHWKRWLDAAGATGVDPRGGTRFSDGRLAIGAAIDGLGVAMALEPLVAAEIAAGRLVKPFELSIPSGSSYYLLIPEAVADRPAVVAFRDWLLAEARRSEGA